VGCDRIRPSRKYRLSDHNADIRQRVKDLAFMSASKTVKQIPATWVTRDNFLPFGQAIFPVADDKPFDREDAQLCIDRGTPRFYIMRVEKRGCCFQKITRHTQCTQCLGSLEGKDWYIAVAPPSDKDYPEIEKMAAFRIPGNCFIKLGLGTWHAGPLFEHEAVNFYNLELSDTNIRDRFTYDFYNQDNLAFEIVSPPEVAVHT
jgi:ureidoglycolate hydrolase